MGLGQDGGGWGTGVGVLEIGILGWGWGWDTRHRWSSRHGWSSRYGMEFQTWWSSRHGWSSNMRWSSRHGWGSRHEMVFQTWGGIPDTGRVSRHGMIGYQTDGAVPGRGGLKQGNLSFSEFSNIRFNLTSCGLNLTSRKIISFTLCGNLMSHQSGILHSLIFLLSFLDFFEKETGLFQST